MLNLQNIDPANVIGEPEHRAKWEERLTRAYDFDAAAARRVYNSARDLRHSFEGSFRDALIACAGIEDGIRTTPKPGSTRDWDK